MSIRKKYAMLASSAAIALVLAACSGDTPADEDSDTDTNGSEEQVDGETEAGNLDFESQVNNEGEAVEEGTLKIAMVADSAFPGIFSNEFYDINTDSQLMGPMYGDLLRQDGNYQWTDGAASFDFDEDENVARLELQEGVKWHDGEEVTVDDVVFTHEIVGHPDYQGVRYNDAFDNIKGMPDYHAGEADSIEGMHVIDDYTLEIEYVDPMGPSILQAGGGFWAYAAPRHHYGDVPVDEMESSPQIREEPIGFGPYKVSNIASGESVEYEAFDDYFEGTPKIDKIIIERVPPSGIVESLKSGEFDLTLGMPADQYDAFKDGIPGYTILGAPGQSYDYLSFKLGEWDAEEKKNIYDPDSKMADINLRKAMAHALDIDSVGEEFYSGLRYRATSHIVPNFEDFFNEDVEGYPYDPEKAEELLDDAGYVDTNDDGYREDPDGEELVITYAARAGSDAAEPISEYFIKAWEEIGLNVELLEGRLHEVNAFYDRVEGDDPEIDVHEGGWGVGSDPTPDGLFGEGAAFNLSRFVSEENNEYIDNMLSQEAFDTDYQVEQFNEWQDYFMNDAAPLIPTFWRTELQLVNDRVSAWSHDDIPGADPQEFGYHAIELLADEPL
ncbi:MAG: oligopeptide ABC transporter substrate-binding protein, partial [Atopostipes sp.]|nr:oligopeptide ABC transporter substrate-binding protein [Atopostipes sp.]